MYGLASRRESSDPSRPGSGSRTPGMAMVLSGSRVTEEVMGYEIESLSSTYDLAQMGIVANGRQTMELNENRSGIGWKFANQGKQSSRPSPIIHDINGCWLNRSQPPLPGSRRIIHNIPRFSVWKPQFRQAAIPPCPHLSPASSSHRSHDGRTIERPQCITSWCSGASSSGNHWVHCSKSQSFQARQPTFAPPSCTRFNNSADIHPLPVHIAISEVLAQHSIPV